MAECPLCESGDTDRLNARRGECAAIYIIEIGVDKGEYNEGHGQGLQKTNTIREGRRIEEEVRGAGEKRDACACTGGKKDVYY